VSVASLGHDVVAQGGEEVGGEVGEGDPVVEVHGVYADFTRSHPRDLGGRYGAALRGHHLGVPLGLVESVHRLFQSVGREPEPVEEP
jgi:hypothetical protein